MRTTKKSKLVVSPSDLEKLLALSKSQTVPNREWIRANILLRYMKGETISGMARALNTTRPLVTRCIDKAIAYGALAALKDLPGRGVKARITDEDKAWVLSLACRSPKDLGHAHERWTYSLLKRHIRSTCEEAGHPVLSRIDKGVLNTILSQGNVKPHKISYYLEKRDPEFEVKMATVLEVYKQIALLNERSVDEKRTSTTISYDEKPSIQAIKNIALQLQPVINQQAMIKRDHEYKRLGTLSLLAGIDLHTGRVIPLVRDRHRSREFIEFLEELDRQYPKDWTIRIILDNHTSHTSKETKAWLLKKPGRFDVVFTPKHGSWLNMIELFFSKIARSFLRHIRVESKKELIDRIYQGIQAINEEPVIFRWKYKMDETNIN
ncbi:MAG: IS630 family transposase [Bacteroidota bacterium]